MGNKNIQFQESLNKNIQNNSFFNSADWRNYFTKMAGRESSYRSDAYNPSGAYGYFQLMPYNRRGKDIDTQFNDVFDLTQQHLQQLSANMTEQDYRKAEQYGIDMYGLAAGAHLGGPGGVLRVLRGKGNPKDSNGTSVLQYMQEFSGTQDPNNVIYGDLNEYFAQPQEELNYEIPDIQSSTEEDQNVLNADLDGLDDWINYIINVERKTPEYKQKLQEYNEAIARYKALGGPINTNNPIQNFSQFKGQLPIVRYSQGGELDNSIIPSSNSVKPNLFYEGGHTIAAPFLNRPANKFLLGGPGDTSILGRYFDSAVEQVKNAGRAVKALLSDEDNTKHTKKQHKSDDSKKEYTWLESLGNKIATKTGLDFLYTDSPNKNMQAIIDHMVTNGNNNNYGIIDKKNQKLYIMNGNDTLRTEEITLGKNVGDGYNILAPSKKVYYRNLPRTTGAGIYNVKVRGHQPGYNNEQMLDLYENKVRSGIALHAPTKDPTRRAAFNNNNQEDNRVSYGCVSGNCGIVQDIINKRQLSESTPLFILPEMEDNYIRENNGVLETIWADAPETYTNDSGTFKYRYNKQKYKSPTSKLSEGGPLNKFEEGGNTDDTKYQAFLEDLKNYAPNLAAPSKDYNMRRYWELRGKPSNWAESQRYFNYLYNVKEDPMFTLEDDGFYHAPSTAFNQDTGIYEFMKSADHPTVKYELNWYDNGDETGPNGLRIPSFEGFKSSQDFKQNYELKYSPIENKYYYIPKQR